MTENNLNRIICVIPARKGSEGLYRKNLRFVGFFTLVNRAIKVAKKIEAPNFIVLSTDDEKIIRKYANKVDLCISRKPELSNSSASVVDVIKDALNKVQNLSEGDLVMLLEPSSPNRVSNDLNSAIQAMTLGGYSSLITVSIVDLKYHPYKVFKSNDSSTLSSYVFNSPKISNRQEIRDNAYYRNGILYLYKAKVAMRMEESVPTNSNFIITLRSVSNVDNLLDLWMARWFWLKYHILKLLSTYN